MTTTFNPVVDSSNKYPHRAGAIDVFMSSIEGFPMARAFAIIKKMAKERDSEVLAEFLGLGSSTREAGLEGVARITTTFPKLQINGSNRIGKDGRRLTDNANVGAIHLIFEIIIILAKENGSEVAKKVIETKGNSLLSTWGSQSSDDRVSILKERASKYSLNVSDAEKIVGSSQIKYITAAMEDFHEKWQSRQADDSN